MSRHDHDQLKSILKDRKTNQNILLSFDLFALFYIDQNHHHQDEDEEDEMVIYRFSFTNALNNHNRANVYGSMLAFSSKSICFRANLFLRFFSPLVRTAAEIRSNAPYHIRRIADPNYIFQPGEEFSVVFNIQSSYMSFQAWLSRTYTGYQHVLTIVEPTAFAMNVIVECFFSSSLCWLSSILVNKLMLILKLKRNE
jgi:hypothetical protein